jgi:hypothetical protein
MMVACVTGSRKKSETYRFLLLEIKKAVTMSSWERRTFPELLPSISGFLVFLFWFESFPHPA